MDGGPLKSDEDDLKGNTATPYGDGKALKRGFKGYKDALKSYEDALNGDEKVFKCNKKALMRHGDALRATRKR